MIETLTKRQKILSVARELFRTQSYEKTTMEEVARAVPMSKATLYTEFKNKEEILLDLCRIHCDEMNDRLERTFAATDKDFLASLKTMLLTLVQAIYGLAETVRTPEVLVYESTRLQATLIDQIQRTPTIVCELLDKAKEAGEINTNEDSAVLADVVLSVLTSYVPPYPRHFSLPSRPTLESITRDLSLLLDLICDGLKQRQP